MTCPRCYSEFENPPVACPECGVRLVRTVSGVMKTSAVMIAAGDDQEFFGSVQDVPEPLRTQLIEITSGSNSGTIVIADKAGKEQITQVMLRREKAKSKGGQTDETAAGGPSKWTRASVIAWAGAALVLAAGGVFAAIFMTR